MSDGRKVGRREALVGIAGAALSVGAVGCNSCIASSRSARQEGRPMTQTKNAASKRMPLVFLPHGGGPWPFIDERVYGAPGMWHKMAKYMHDLAMVPPSKPEAVLVISAHWEEAQPTVLAAKHPPMLYDYYGFPKEAYQVKWPAPGQPELASKVRDLLERADIKAAADDKRGFDHGTFVPLKLTYPQADVPTIQLSLVKGLDPKKHLQIGRALEPLRDQGVFIVGSGMSYHNLRQLMASMRGQPQSGVRDDSKAFDEWLGQAMLADASRRETALVEWEKAPKARASHPREEHLLPLMVVAGAAGNDAGSVPYRDVVMGAHVSAVQFG